uniref:FBA domain-containing protein n=1 Tax=Neovison vison TaxID=452646 RepID=A0A8C7BAZ4_NEOVI
MDAGASRRPRARVSAREPEPEEVLDLSRLPLELLLLVLSHVPPRTLRTSCRRDCLPARLDIRPGLLRCLQARPPEPPVLLSRFCELRPFGRNLIRNPCGQEGLQGWTVQHGGDGWVVEVNLTQVPGAPSQNCFVSSYKWCSKKQVLDLVKEGLWPELLDSGRIEICVSDWWGARDDCGCVYRLLVQLLDARLNVLDEFSSSPDPVQNAGPGGVLGPPGRGHLLSPTPLCPCLSASGALSVPLQKACLL